MAGERAEYNWISGLSFLSLHTWVWVSTDWKIGPVTVEVYLNPWAEMMAGMSR